MANIMLDRKWKNQQGVKGMLIKSRSKLAYEEAEREAAMLSAASESRESWTVAKDSDTAFDDGAEGALFYTETAETRKLKSALKRDIHGGDASDDGSGSPSSRASLAANSPFAEPEPRVYGLVDPHLRAGAPTAAADARRLDACERDFFPRVGDEVEIHHAEKWRRATVSAIKPTRWLRNKPSTLKYDVRLVCDGNSSSGAAFPSLSPRGATIRC